MRILGSLAGRDQQESASERGSLLLFALVILPLLLTATLFSLDLTRYYLLRQSAQKSSDALVHESARFLPDIQRAEAHLYRRASQLTDIALARSVDGAPQATITSDRVSVVTTATLRPLLANLLPHRNQSDSLALTIYESASARIIPTDIALVFSDGIAPEPFEVWGDLAQWPAAPVLETLGIPCWSGECATVTNKERLWLTQRCYNPVFSAIKKTLLDVYQHYSRSTLNRITVLTTPGDNDTRSFEHLSAGLAQPNAIQSGPWSNWQDPVYPVSDDLCVYIARAQVGHTSSEYGFPLPKPQSLFDCHPFRTYAPTNFTPQGTLSDCFLESLQPTERIWYRAARQRRETPNDVLEALKEATRQLRDGAQSPLPRGRFTHRPERLLLALVTDVPENMPELLKLLGTIDESNIQLGLFVVSQPGLAEFQLQQRNARIEAVASVLNANPQNGIIRQVSDPRELFEFVTSDVLHKSNRAVLEF